MTVFTSIAIVTWFNFRHTHATSDTSLTTQTNSVSPEIQSPEDLSESFQLDSSKSIPVNPVPRKGFKNLESSELTSTHPFAPEDIELLGKVMTNAKNHLDPKKARLSFQASHHDSLENFSKAKIQLLGAYPNEAGSLKPFIEQRILALYYMQYTKHLTWEDCEQGLGNIVDQFDPSGRTHLQINLEFDFASLAKRCTQDFPKNMYAHFNTSGLPNRLRSQLAFIYEQEEIHQ
jgi:hypothetical protein